MSVYTAEAPRPHPQLRIQSYVTLYVLQLVLTYGSVLTPLLGVWMVLGVFGLLFFFGLVLVRPSLLGRIPALSDRSLVAIGLGAIFFNLSSLLFGGHFSLFSASPLLLVLFLSPLVVILRSRALQIGGLAAALLCIDVALIETTPLDRSGGMLTLIDAAGDVLLSGRNPYQERLEVPIGDRGFIYVPGLLIAYLPAKALGIDIRYVNVTAAVLFWIYLTLGGGRKQPEGRWRAETLLSFAILTSPNVSHLISTKHTFFYGVFLFLLTFFVRREMETASGLLLGVVIVIRQFSLVLAPSVLWAMRRKWLRSALWLSVVVGIVFGPFVALDPGSFVSVFTGKSNFGRYDDVRVDWSQNYSPGAGNSFNLGHAIKVIIPAWSSALTMTVVGLLEAANLLALVMGRLRPVQAMYFAYAVYLAFTVNFSDYLLWDNLCIGWAIAWSERDRRLDNVNEKARYQRDWGAGP
jgi:hypothetical protein